MTRLLLDSHTLIWWLEGNRKLSAAARQAIEADNAEIHVSAASAYEIAYKSLRGFIEGGEHLVANWSSILADNEFRELPVTHAHALRAGALPRHHRDPFDRLLIASALEDGLALVTNDAAMTPYGAATLW